MLSRIWSGVMLAAVVYGIIHGSMQEMGMAVVTAGEDSLKLAMTLMASMTLWSGLMEILSEAGDMRRLGGCIRKLAGPLFGGIRDPESWDAISMNLAANLLGLGNAATPAGIRAAQLLAEQGQAGMTALAAFLALNNAGLQLLPTTVITMRAAAGSTDPGGIWGVTMISAATSAVVSLVVLQVFRRVKGGRRE